MDVTPVAGCALFRMRDDGVAFVIGLKNLLGAKVNA